MACLAVLLFEIWIFYQFSKKEVSFDNSFKTMQLLFNNLNDGSGAHTITASAGDSYAYESSKWNNGVFTYAILSGLRDGKADLNNDKSITISELKQFVSSEVFAQTKGMQQPTFREENVDYDWVVWNTNE